MRRQLETVGAAFVCLGLEAGKSAVNLPVHRGEPIG
jgi:hypothetical protein